MDWYDRKFESLLMGASEETSRMRAVRLMDDLKESRLYRWMGTGICVAVSMYIWFMFTRGM